MRVVYKRSEPRRCPTSTTHHGAFRLFPQQTRAVLRFELGLTPARRRASEAAGWRPRAPAPRPPGAPAGPPTAPQEAAHSAGGSLDNRLRLLLARNAQNCKRISANGRGVLKSGKRCSAASWAPLHTGGDLDADDGPVGRAGVHEAQARGPRRGAKGLAQRAPDRQHAAPARAVGSLDTRSSRETRMKKPRMLAGALPTRLVARRLKGSNTAGCNSIVDFRAQAEGD